jgi:hypothetical protein
MPLGARFTFWAVCIPTLSLLSPTWSGRECRMSRDTWRVGDVMTLQREMRAGRALVVGRTLGLLATIGVIGTIGTTNACAADRATSAAPDSISAAERADAARTMAAWNTIALRTTAAGPFSPPQETRSMAIVSAAVFDAVNAIGGQYEPFVARVTAQAGASRSVAAATAAHQVLRTLYPNAVAALDADYDSTLALTAAGASKTAGIAVGEAAATAALAARASDHAAERVTYTPQGTAGMWAPTPPAMAAALEAGWGNVTPFAMTSGSQFRPAAPPAMGSADYVRDVNEIVAIGVAASQTRTAAQTEAARFWISTAPQLWNQVARQLTVARDLDPATAARAYLLLNVAGADAIIAAWDAKYTFQQWRPVTAIRRSSATGSLAAPLDTTWTPLLGTPPFPDYPAGHTAYGGAAEMVLESVFGAQPGELSITSATANGATHRYQSFREVGDEVVNARVWGGVHWRTSATVGRDVGHKVADLALQRVARKR